MGLWGIPQNCPLVHPAVLLVFGQANLQVFWPRSSCLMTTIFAIHHCLLYNPMITIIYSSSFETTHHPLTQKKQRHLAKILKLCMVCVPGSFFLIPRWPTCPRYSPGSLWFRQVISFCSLWLWCHQTTFSAITRLRACSFQPLAIFLFLPLYWGVSPSSFPPITTASLLHGCLLSQTEGLLRL